MIVALVVAVAMATAMATAASALAKASQVPPGNSEVEQYLPTLPGAGGDTPLGGGGGGTGGGATGGAPLPRSTASALAHAGPLGRAAALSAERTSPQVADEASAGTSGAGAGGAGGSSDQKSVGGILLDGFGYGGQGGLGIFLPIILGAVLGAGAYAIVRRHRASARVSTGT